MILLSYKDTLKELEFMSNALKTIHSMTESPDLSHEDKVKAINSYTAVINVAIHKRLNRT